MENTENKTIDVTMASEMFKRNLIDLINQNGLPIGVTYYVIKDIYQETEAYYNQYVNMQLMQMQQAAAVPEEEATEVVDETN